MCSRYRPSRPTSSALALLALVGWVLPATVARGGPSSPPSDELRALAARAVSGDPADAKAAAAQLRAAGPQGLAVLLDENAAAVQRHRSGDSTGTHEDDWPTVAAAIDAVAAQKDAYASGLYWYTNLDAAKQAARESGKPILSLRLLGMLDTEFSCANSRFFRTVLYANADVSAALRERFVLHWQSVRPVPKITIDFGDGRRVERTITGNSIHYLLDADGTVVDALPGLYGPRAFLGKLTEAAVVEKGTRAMAAGDRRQFLRNWHAGKAAEDLAAWQTDLRAVGALPVAAAAAGDADVPPAPVLKASAEAAAPAGPVTGAALARVAPPAPPPAMKAAPLARGKAMAERPLVVALAPDSRAVAPPAPPAAPPPADRAGRLAVGKAKAEMPAVVALAPKARPTATDTPPRPTTPPTLRKAAPIVPAPSAPDPEAASTDGVWEKVAALHAEEARLDAGSRSLMARKVPPATRANATTDAKRDVEAPLLRIVRNFERSIAEDTVRNEYTFHRTIHTWLAAGPGKSGVEWAGDVNTLNERVYADLFLTPSSDPWLGLVPPDTYTALEGDGLCRTK